MTEKLYTDFDIYTRALLNTNDEDPVYKFIKSTLNHFDFHREWFCLAYTTFYSLGTAMTFCKEMPSPEHFDEKKFLQMRGDGTLNHFGIERRGTNRAPLNQAKMLSDISKKMKLFVKSAGTLSQAEFRKLLNRELIFHGVWATFKVSEVFEKALDYENLSIPDMGIIGKDVNSNDGPIGGLRWLFGRDEVYDNSWYPVWDKFGLKLSKKYNTGIGNIESCLCKAHKIISGNYWVGHDIAEMVELKHTWGEKKWNICMKENFHPDLWQNLTHFPKENKKVYQSTGKILNANFAAGLPSVDIIEVMKEVLN